MQPTIVQYDAYKYVRVSEVASYYLCPRLTYFERREEPVAGEAEVRAGVFKLVSLELGPVMLSPQPEAALDKAISQACTDALFVYGLANERAITKAGQEIQGRRGDVLSGLISERGRLGEKSLACLLSPFTISLAIYSDKLHMSGTIDKVACNDGSMEPVIISASLPPSAGVYASDRVRLTAYAMLLSEKYDIECGTGWVEYVQGWRARRAEVRHEDKRKALYARNRVLGFADGRMPDAMKGKWCGHCMHYDACSVKATLLDSLFKRRG